MEAIADEAWVAAHCVRHSNLQALTPAPPLTITKHRRSMRRRFVGCLCRRRSAAQSCQPHRQRDHAGTLHGTLTPFKRWKKQ
jgi:hypothetical protein